MKSTRSHHVSPLLAAVAVGVIAFAARAQTADQTTPSPQKAGLQQPPEPKVPKEQEGLDVVENVGDRLPMNLAFTDSLGKKVTLADYFTNDTRPAIIVMGYYRCPIVCGVIREKLIQSLAGVDNTIGKDFRVLAFSIAPDEVPDAAEKARTFDHAFYANHPSSAGGQITGLNGLIYHVSDAANVRLLADALGYKYRPVGNEFTHPVVITLTTPDGTISRYLYGFGQDPKNLKLAIMEASEGKLVRSIGERIMAFCYMYDPKAGSYTLQAVRVMQIGGVLSVLGVGSLVGVMFLGERIRRRGAAGKRKGVGGPVHAGAGPEVVVVAS